MHRKVEWHDAELILALGLYFELKSKGKALGYWISEVKQLSIQLKQLNIPEHEYVVPDFRNPSGISRVLYEFLALDNQTNKPWEVSYGVHRIWTRFIGNREELREVVASITKIDSSELANTTILDEEFYYENEKYLRLHNKRERNRKVVDAKKAKALRVGRLVCEVCGFDYFDSYGKLNHEFIECHHRVPLSELEGTVKTVLDDLAIVCANCHRMLHSRKPFYSVEELRDIIQSAYSKR